jgi:hypothetical protein
MAGDIVDNEDVADIGGGADDDDEDDNDETGTQGADSPSSVSHKRARESTGAGTQIKAHYSNPAAVSALGTNDLDEKTLKSYQTLQTVSRLLVASEVTRVDVCPCLLEYTL